MKALQDCAKGQGHCILTSANRIMRISVSNHNMELERVQPNNLFKPLHLSDYTTVGQAHKTGKLTDDSDLIVFHVAGKPLAFSKHMMAFHHIAQGKIKDVPYMLTFCVICHSGMILSPIVNHEILHFEIAGTYNGMLLMKDRETQSYWDHITGICLSGIHEGYQLDILRSHDILPTKVVLELYPDCLFGREKMNVFQKGFTAFINWKANINGKGFFPPGFRNSMLTIDPRLPEMEMGLGIYDGQSAKFYPLKAIKPSQHYLVDTVNGRPILIYISPSTKRPEAIYQSGITEVIVTETTLNFPDGRYLQNGILYSVEGNRLAVDKPNQMFLRWYGFVSTFPHCEVQTINYP